jgi:hypothetical protein
MKTLKDNIRNRFKNTRGYINDGTLSLVSNMCRSTIKMFMWWVEINRIDDTRDDIYYQVIEDVRRL